MSSRSGKKICLRTFFLIMSARVSFVARRSPRGTPVQFSGVERMDMKHFEGTSGSCLDATIVSDEKTFIVVRNFHAFRFIILSTKWTMSHANKGGPAVDQGGKIFRNQT